MSAGPVSWADREAHQDVVPEQTHQVEEGLLRPRLEQAEGASCHCNVQTVPRTEVRERTMNFKFEESHTCCNFDSF